MSTNAPRFVTQPEGTSRAGGPADEVIGPITPPLPDGWSDWDQVNARRIQLLESERERPLSPSEAAELDRLQAGFFQYLDAKYPRTPLDESRLDAIEARLRAAESPPKDR